MDLPASVILSDRIWGSAFVALGLLILVCFRRILARLTEAPKKVSGPSWYTGSLNLWVEMYDASPFWRAYDRFAKFI